MTLSKPEFTATPIMPHQRAALRAAWGRESFAYLMEQGTGKSLTLLAEALALHAQGAIEGLLILAPNGVHISWVREQVAQHAPAGKTIAAYLASDMTRGERAAVAALFAPEVDRKRLRVLTASYDTLMTEENMRAAERFLAGWRCMLAADESHKIKTPSAARTKRALRLAQRAAYRRILTGTAIAGSPEDAWSQFEFLRPGCLGESSIVSFRAQYCELLLASHGLMRHITQRGGRAPQIVARDRFGRPKYRNLDQLQTRIAEHSFRVLKEDCLDLPPKQYETLYFKLTPGQRRVYDELERELRVVLDDGTAILTPSKLVALGKLRQVTSGFLLLPDGTAAYMPENPRLATFLDAAEGEEARCLVWSQFKEEQRAIDYGLRKAGATVALINGDTPRKQREELVAEWRTGNIQWLNAHPETLGTGFTLAEAQRAYFFSNGYKMVERVQAEDRNHRIGSVGEVVMYRDLVALDTVDEAIARAHQAKLDIAATIYGERRKERPQ